MPRPWSDYSMREWLRIKPFEQRWKYALYQLKARPLEWRAPERGDIRETRSAVRGRRVLATVAFHDPQFIDLQARLIRRYVDDCVHLVVDNSRDPAIALEIERVANANGSQYLKLRPPPWTRPVDGGRAHASAMNWTWRNVLRPSFPAVFGFIDHDLFPVRPTDPFEPLKHHLVGGQVRVRAQGKRWYIWAGYCFFRFSAVSMLRLDFSLDWNAGLDTGGANWFVIYRRLSPEQVFDVGEELEQVDGLPLDVARFERVGDWLHYSNFSTPHDLDPEQRAALKSRKRQVLIEQLHRLLAE
jgi:hypothetical protein